jgi:hypothetical protein
MQYNFNWDNTANQWVGVNKYENTYNSDRHITLYIFYDWDKSTGQCVYSIKVETTYDERGNISLQIRYGWDKTTSRWIGETKDEYIYDSSGNQTLNVPYDWDRSTSQYIPVARSAFYYSEHTFIPVISEKQINVYPNPSSEYILFDVGNISGPALVEIFNNQGTKVLEEDLSRNRQINIAKLGGGLYLYKLNYNGTIYAGKFIVK